MQFDLLKLHNPKEGNTPLKWISAYGAKLQPAIQELANEIVDLKAQRKVFYELRKEDMTRLLKAAYRKISKQQDLAKKLKVPRQLLYRWKVGAQRISKDEFGRLVRFTKSNKPKLIKTVTQLRGITKQELSRRLAKILKISLNGPERIFYKHRQLVPLVFIRELLKLWKDLLKKDEQEYIFKKNYILSTIEFLKQNHPKAQKVKAVTELTPTLAKIVGAIIADGCVARNSNTIQITDGHRENSVRFAEWIKAVFGMQCKIRNAGLAYYIKIDNRVIYRYLTKFFDFIPGIKAIDHDLPTIIKNSDFNIQRACAHGIMSFDGVVRTNSEIGINIKSKNLRDSLFKIFQRSGLAVRKSKNKDKTGMWRLYSARDFKNKEQFVKWGAYFAENTPKWFKIYNWIFGYSQRVNSYDEALGIFNKYFPATSNSRITLATLLELFIEKGKLTIAELREVMESKGSPIALDTAWFYFARLKEMKIVSKIRHGNSNTYVLNPIENWRLPLMKTA